MLAKPGCRLLVKKLLRHNRDSDQLIKVRKMATPTSSFPRRGLGRVGVVFGVWVKVRVRVIVGLGLETGLGEGRDRSV